MESQGKDTSGQQELRRRFEALVQRPDTERQAALDELEGRDPEMARQLRRLLHAHGKREGFLETPLPAQFDAEADLAGEWIGSYQIQRKVSQGGMGVVYEAVRADDAFRMRVALKVVRAGLSSDFLRERFLRERQILAALEHPNIARILDGGTTGDGRPYLVMEYVEGVPIDRYVEANSSPLVVRLELFRQACEAVQFAHRHLIVHRDLKPANILVTAEGTVKLLDFGIAKILADQPGTGVDATATGVWLMTPEWASPEQIKGKAITTQTDVFLLGLLLYELLAGAHPFRGESRLPHEVLRAICEDEPARPSVVAGARGRHHKGRLSDDLDKIVLMSLRKDPERRYASVEALSTDIDRYLTGLPVAAQGDRLAYRAVKFVRRRWLPVMAAAVMFASLAGAVQVSQRALRRAEQQRMMAEDAARQAQLEREKAERRRVEAEKQRVRADEERARAERNMEAQRSLATNLTTLADSRFWVGDFKAAIDNLEQGVRAEKALASTDSNDLGSRKIIGLLEYRLCTVQASSGDPAGAVKRCKASIDQLEPLRGSKVDDKLMRNSLAAAYGTYAKLETTARKASEGVIYGRKAVQMIQALVAGEPGNKEYEQRLGATRTYLAEALFADGKKAEALDQVGRATAALRMALNTHPDDRRAVNRLAITLVRQSAMLQKDGDVALAREAMRQAISVYRAFAESPGATHVEFNEYANWLVKCDFPELWQPQVALEYAQRAVKGTNESNPGYLDTLAWAYFRMGDAAAAAELQRKALRLIDQNKTFQLPALRRELEEGLKEFESAAANK